MSSKLAERIAHVPELYETGEQIHRDSFEDAGMPEAAPLPSSEEIAAVLAHEPELTELWLERGGDQRLAGGWGIERDPDGAYRVQDFSGGPGIIERNRLKACAQFVVRYVAFIDKVIRRGR